VFQAIAINETVTARMLAKLVYGNDNHSTITTLNKILDILDDRCGLIHRTFYRPYNYSGRGNLPNVSWLSPYGAEKANELFTNTYPKSFLPSRSFLNIPHDIARAETHISFSDLCKKEGWRLGWRKGDRGSRLVRPDDIFEITQNKTAHFFLEEEHIKKTFDALYLKLKPYVTFHDTGQMKEAWGFRYYTVIVPMRDRDAMTNLITHFKGSCNCIDPKLKYMHKGSPFKLHTDVLAFTTHEDVMERTGESILHAPSGKTYALLDIVK
jgi:hypothetical protein